MKRLMVRTGFVVLLLSTESHAQSGSVVPQAGTGHTPQASCVILKRMGRADRTKSRLYSLGISGKRFRYIEGKVPEGFSLHGKMTDHDVGNLQSRGIQVLVLDSHYTSQDLQEARAACQQESGKTPNQVEAKASPEPVPSPTASTPAPTPNPPTPKPSAAKAPTPKADRSVSSADAVEAALIDVSSTPAGAEVYIDEHFFGRTPATAIILVPGSYKIAVKKDGFVVWKKKLKFPSGPTNVNAQLLPKGK